MANTPENKVSRRTLAKGAAWAVPVVSAAAMAPSVAASELDTAPKNVTAARTGCMSARVEYDGIAGETYTIQGFDGTDWGSTTPSTHDSIGSGSVVLVSFDSNIQKVRIRHSLDSADSDWVEKDLGAIPTPGPITSVTVTRSGPVGGPYTYRVTVAPDDQEFDTYYYETTENNGNWNKALSGTVSPGVTPFEFQGADGIKQIRVRRDLCGASSTFVTVSSPWALTPANLARESAEASTESAKLEASATETPKGNKPAEAGPSAPKKPTPAEPKPTVAPEPKVTVAPEPAPIVSEAAPVPVPEPAVSPTPAG